MKAFGNLFSSSKPVNKPTVKQLSSHISRPSEENEEDSEMVAVIDENERYLNGKWSSDNLLPLDPLRFKSSAGESHDFPNPPLAEGWVWVGDWEIEKLTPEQNSDDFNNQEDSEWMYAMSFDELENGYVALQSYSRTRGQYQVRRKRWIRAVKPTMVHESRALTQTNLTNTTKNSNSSSASNSLPPRSINQMESIYHGDELSATEDDFDSTIHDNTSIIRALDAKFEVESDTDEYNPEAEEPEKLKTNIMLNRGISVSNISPHIMMPAEFNIRVRDPTLIAIGKQIKAIETQCKAIEDSDNADWTKYHKPALAIQIQELEKVCNQLKVRIDNEISFGIEHITKLEDELKGYTTRLEEAKKKFYFPQSLISLGQGGIYVALDDFWLENASGHFEVDLIPSKDNPQIRMIISGAKDLVDGGIAIRLRVDGFKLAGDKGKRIPKIKFDNMKVLVSLRASIFINYDVASSKWVVTNPKNFKIELLSFKGPYGITQSMVGAVLSVITPILRSRILGALPPELGLLMRTFPSPFSCRGEFDITGPELLVLSTPLEKSPLLCQMFEYSSSQMDMFQWLQKSMDRSKIIRTMTDLLQYVRSFVKYKESWTTLITLWNQAAKIYSEKITTIRYEQINNHLNPSQHQPIDPLQTTITFNTFLTVAEDFRKKRLGAYFKLQYMDGQLSLNQILRYGHQLFHRNATEASKKATGIRQARLVLMLERIQSNYEQGLEAIKLISRNIDFAQLKIKASLDAGPQGKCHIMASDIMAQLPLVLSFTLMKEKNLGHSPPVPYIISIKPQEDGDLFVEIYHYSKEGLEQSMMGERKTRGIGDPVRRRSTHSQEGSPRSRSHSAASNHNNNNSHNSSTIDLLNISSLAQSSLNTLKKGVTQVTNTIHEGIQKIDTTATDKLNQWSSTPRSSLLGIKRRTTGAYGFSNAERRNQELEQTLNNMPQGDVADTILIMNVSRPHISMVVDRPLNLKPGAEIFTVLVGPREKDWKPFGAENTGIIDAKRADSSSKPHQLGTNISTESMKNMSPTSDRLQTDNLNGTSLTKESEEGKGCPILIQTSPGIKLMNQIPKAEVTVNLPGLVRFVSAHFDDIDLLKNFIEKLAGGEIFEEHLNLFKMILDRFAKYLLLPGVNIDININGKLVALNNEIMISIETPDFSTSDTSPTSDKSQTITNPASRRGSSILIQRPTPSEKNKGKNSLCALKVHAEMNLIDIVEDSLAVEQSLKSFE